MSAILLDRRSFLKNTATAAIVVPIMGLLGQRSIAEAAAQTVQNQPFGYAPPALRAYEHDFMPMLDSVLKALYDGGIQGDVASRLVHSLLDVLIAVADKSGPSPSRAIQAFTDEVRAEEVNLPSALSSELLTRAGKQI